MDDKKVLIDVCERRLSDLSTRSSSAHTDSRRSSWNLPPSVSRTASSGSTLEWSRLQFYSSSSTQGSGHTAGIDALPGLSIRRLTLQETQQRLTLCGRWRRREPRTYYKDNPWPDLMIVFRLTGARQEVSESCISLIQ